MMGDPQLQPVSCPVCPPNIPRFSPITLASHHRECHSNIPGERHSMTPREALDKLERASMLSASEHILITTDEYVGLLAQIVRYALPGRVTYNKATEDAISRAYDNGRRDAGVDGTRYTVETEGMQ